MGLSKPLAGAAIVAVIAWPSATGATSTSGGADECVKPDGVQRLVFSRSNYPNIRRHFHGALRRGWPRRLVLNRRGADARRDRLLENIPTREGFDRDEYPPAVGRGKGPGLERGRHPRGWKADVRYLPSSENRSHGASLGTSWSRSATARGSGTCSDEGARSRRGLVMTVAFASA
jgi:hypothetical protein